MPVAVFHRCLAGDFSECPESQFAVVFDEYIKRFGVNPAYLSYLKQLRNMVLNYYNAYIGGNKSAATMAEVMERQSQQALSEEASQSFETTAALVAKFMGFRIDIEAVSVTEFYSYLKLMQQHGK